MILRIQPNYYRLPLREFAVNLYASPHKYHIGISEVRMKKWLLNLR